MSFVCYVTSLQDVNTTVGCDSQRPLSFVSEGDHNSSPLTPNMLIFGRNLKHNFQSLLPEVDFNDPSYEFGSHGNLNSMCKKLKSTLASVRKNWNSDYLSFLRERDINRNKRSPATSANKYTLRASAGDVVLVVQGDKSLRLGRILKLIPSSDGEIRSAQVRTGNSVATQSLTNLRHFESCPLRPDDEAQPNLPSPVDIRPRRAAALAAQQRWVENLLFVVPPS